MKHLIDKSELREEILKSIKDRNDRRTILLSINTDILVFLLEKYDFELNVFFESEKDIDEKLIQSLIIYNFSKSELLDSLYLKTIYSEESKLFFPNENIDLEINSYNSNNENILFQLLETNQLITLKLIFEGMGIWNSYSLFIRNMNNEVFILRLYNEYNKELLEVSKTEIFGNMDNLNINTKDENGDTLLHLAVKKYDEEIVNFCLLNGANPYLKNNFDIGIFDNTDMEFWKDILKCYSVEV
jgi:ankyrin repeat protein